MNIDDDSWVFVVLPKDREIMERFKKCTDAKRVELILEHAQDSTRRHKNNLDAFEKMRIRVRECALAKHTEQEKRSKSEEANQIQEESNRIMRECQALIIRNKEFHRRFSKVETDKRRQTALDNAEAKAFIKHVDTEAAINEAADMTLKKKLDELDCWIMVV